MKNKIVCIIVSMLLFATVFSVAMPANKSKSDSRDVDWWPMFQHDTKQYKLLSPDPINTLLLTTAGDDLIGPPVV